MLHRGLCCRECGQNKQCSGKALDICGLQHPHLEPAASPQSRNQCQPKSQSSCLKRHVINEKYEILFSYAVISKTFWFINLATGAQTAWHLPHTKVEYAITGATGGVGHQLRNGERQLLERITAPAQGVAVQGAILGVREELRPVHLQMSSAFCNHHHFSLCHCKQPHFQHFCVVQRAM